MTGVHSDVRLNSPFFVMPSLLLMPVKLPSGTGPPFASRNAPCRQPFPSRQLSLHVPAVSVPPPWRQQTSLTPPATSAPAPPVNSDPQQQHTHAPPQHHVGRPHSPAPLPPMPVCPQAPPHRLKHVARKREPVSGQQHAQGAHLTNRDTPQSAGAINFSPPKQQDNRKKLNQFANSPRTHLDANTIT